MKGRAKFGGQKAKLENLKKVAAMVVSESLVNTQPAVANVRPENPPRFGEKTETPFGLLCQVATVASVAGVIFGATTPEARV